MEEGVGKAEKKEPAETEKKSEALPEEKETEETKADEERVKTEEKSITTPPEDDLSKEILEEACDESHEQEEAFKRDEAIECGEGIDNTPFYLQSDIVHTPKEKVKEFTIMVKEESTLTEEPPPVINKSEGCSHEKEEPEWKEEERIRRIQKLGKPPHSEVRPKQIKKVLGMYMHHRKKRDTV